MKHLELDELNKYLGELLDTCPKRPAKGVNRWLITTAWKLREHVKPEPEVFLRLLKVGVANCGRIVTDYEIMKAVQQSPK